VMWMLGGQLLATVGVRGGIGVRLAVEWSVAMDTNGRLWRVVSVCRGERLSVGGRLVNMS
jgi:hypothetical protein